MKKLLIAAGIAAATMASFNASANTYDSSSLSHASVNSVVTGSSIVTVAGTDGGTFNTTDILAAGKTLGTFDIQLPDNIAVLGFGISGIHSHGFPDGFKVKFNNCIVKVESQSQMKRVVGGQDALADGNLGQECVFTKSTTSVVVTTETNTAEVAPGTKTITADFTAYTN